MEQTRKKLKLSSIMVLVLTGFYMLELIGELMYGEFNQIATPEGAPDNILLITKIFVLSISFLFLLPNIYIGIKGLRIAKEPNESKGHIIWGVILLILALLSLVEPVVGFINNNIEFEGISAFFSIIVEIAVFFEYIKYAIAVRKTVA